MFGFSRLIGIVLSLGLITASITHAETAPAPNGQPILEITDLTSGGSAVAIALDLAALEAMEKKEIVTSTIWTSGVNSFEGVPLDQLLSALQIDGSVIRATAINDYAIDIPLDETFREHAILAYRMNGAPMSRRGKGPLWIVYPFDQSPKFRTETIYARSIWQLNRIQVIK